MNIVALPKRHRRCCHDTVGTAMSALIKLSSPFSLFPNRFHATAYDHVTRRSHHLDSSQPLYPLTLNVCCSVTAPLPLFSTLKGVRVLLENMRITESIGTTWRKWRKWWFGGKSDGSGRGAGSGSVPLHSFLLFRCNLIRVKVINNEDGTRLGLAHFLFMFMWKKVDGVQHESKGGAVQSLKFGPIEF